LATSPCLEERSYLALSPFVLLVLAAPLARTWLGDTTLGDTTLGDTTLGDATLLDTGSRCADPTDREALLRVFCVLIHGSFL
jgi:hypothetical protein